MTKIYVNIFPAFLLKLEDTSKEDFIKGLTLIQDMYSQVEIIYDFNNCIDINLVQQLKNSKMDLQETSSGHYYYIKCEKDFSNFVDIIENKSFELLPKLNNNTKIFNQDLLSTADKKILNELRSYISEESIKLNTHKDELSKEVEKFLKNTGDLLKLFLDFTPITSEPSETKIIFYELYKILLFTHVELNFAKHFKIDPTIGWINQPINWEKKETKYLSSPFLFFTFDSNLNGKLDSIDYLPRKISLSQQEPNLYFSSSNSSSKVEPSSPPRIMRRNLDFFGVKFFEVLEIENNNTIEIQKIFYLKAGLAPLGNYSTCGFDLDFWISDDHLNLINCSENELIELNLNLSFECEPNLIKFRHLGEMGGISDSIYNTENHSNLIVKAEVGQSPILGLRLIDSISNLVIDLRSSRKIEKINIKPLDSKHSNSLVNIQLNYKLNSLLGYEKVTNLAFVIY